MPRYFIEVAYKGTNYSGFQRQENANTIQAEVEKAFQILHRNPVFLTGSSRTDAGVHALQNYFHFDYDLEVHPQFSYKMNAILPADIVIKDVRKVSDNTHSRFDATSREYEYRLYQYKNPFLADFALYYPYSLDVELLNDAAALVVAQTNFASFSKTNTQVKNFNCTIYKSQWINRGDLLVYNIEANRFLRGMVRLLTASILKVGRGVISLKQFELLFLTDSKCGYSVPAHGLFLTSVRYPSI